MQIAKYVYLDTKINTQLFSHSFESEYFSIF